MTFETLITILTIENLNSWKPFYLTINCDTGQHSQFLRCFLLLVPLVLFFLFSADDDFDHDLMTVLLTIITMIFLMIMIMMIVARVMKVMMTMILITMSP